MKRHPIVLRRLDVSKQFVVSRLSALALGSRGSVQNLLVALLVDGVIALF